MDRYTNVLLWSRKIKDLEFSGFPEGGKTWRKAAKILEFISG
jgi:hypothetical protein